MGNLRCNNDRSSARRGLFHYDGFRAKAAAGVQRISANGFTGGFEAGYNFQASNWVFGIEGDIESFHLSGNGISGPVVYLSAPPSTFTVISNASTSWLATARGRVGVATDNWLFIATGGAAFTNLKANFAFTDNFLAPPGAAESSSFSSNKTGYALGGGLEAGFWGHWSLKAEYLYIDFGQISAISTNLTTSEGAFPQNSFTHSIKLKANIARVGLNYHF
jgi:outer membrane immunogenic protein